MASISATSISPRPSSPALLSTGLNFGRKPSVLFFQSSAMRIQAPLRLQICCVAKPDTVGKVTDIVKKQLALKDDTSVTGETKFSELGADSLDTVEIVMRLEEEFGVTVEEENAQSITTIGEAADLIEKLQNA